VAKLFDAMVSKLAHKIAMLVSLSWFLFQFGGRIIGFIIPVSSILS
jgi:hypothetical protein